MLVVLSAGGLKNGGLNFDARVRRESVHAEDLFLGHIGGMDTFARGLETAYRILADSDYQAVRKRRYQSFDDGDGARFEAGRLDLAELRDLAADHGEPQPRSGRQEWFENLINQYL